jgi:hypothetical protein
MQCGGALQPPSSSSSPAPVSLVVVLGNSTVSEEVVLEGEAAVRRTGKFVYRARLRKAVEVYKTLSRYHMATPLSPSAPALVILLAKTYASKEGELGAHQADIREMLCRDPGFLQQEQEQGSFRDFSRLLSQHDRLWAGGSDDIVQTWRSGDNTHDTIHEAVGCRWLLEQKFEHLLGNAAAPLHVVVVTSACHHARTRWIFDGVFEDAAWARVSFDVSDTTATELGQRRLDVEAQIWARQLKSVASHGGFAGFINAEFDPSGSLRARQVTRQGLSTG